MSCQDNEDRCLRTANSCNCEYENETCCDKVGVLSQVLGEVKSGDQYHYDIIPRNHAEGEKRGILVDVDDPLLPADDTSSLQETPSLSGVFFFVCWRHTQYSSDDNYYGIWVWSWQPKERYAWKNEWQYLISSFHKNSLSVVKWLTYYGKGVVSSINLLELQQFSCQQRDNILFLYSYVYVFH